MRRSRSLGLVVGGCFTFLLIAPALASAGPAVTVRVEGLAGTLVARTVVTTGAATVTKDGDPAHACAGDSAAGALELATAGSWAGTWDAGFGDYAVSTIAGETYPIGAQYAGIFWAIYVDGESASAGICNTTLAQGDDLLLAAVRDSDPNGVLNISGLPARAAPGGTAVVTVSRSLTTYGGPPDYAPINTTAPAAGATVSYAGTTVSTGADGTATLSFAARGSVAVRATRAGDIRSVTETTCVTDGADGFCDTAPPPTTVPPAAGPPDTTPAFGKIAAIREGQHFARGKGPRELRGTVAADASGLAEVRLRLTRRSGKRCEQFDGTAARWVSTARCGTENGRFFAIGNAAAWSYLLPETLSAGRYVLDTQTVDGAGNVTRGADRGTPGQARNRVVFTVG